MSLDDKLLRSPPRFCQGCIDARGCCLIDDTCCWQPLCFLEVEYGLPGRRTKGGIADFGGCDRKMKCGQFALQERNILTLQPGSQVSSL